MMSYRADKLGVDAHARTHTQTDAGNDNTRRPKLASGNKSNDKTTYMAQTSHICQQYVSINITTVMKVENHATDSSVGGH